jgi:hypothetical protein
MTRINIIAIYGCALLSAAALAGGAQAQAFVNQATPPGGASVYVDQVPPGARPRPPQQRAARPAARKQTVQTKASVVDEVSSTARLVPTVGSGSTAVIRLTNAREWPSVGSGTIRK